MTDEEERSRYSDDALLVGSTEKLMAVDGQLRIVSRAINTVEEPLEPKQEEVLMVLMAETGNRSLEETYPFEVAVNDEGQGGSLGSNESVKEPSTPSTEFVEEPLERDETVTGSVDGFPVSQQHRCAGVVCMAVMKWLSSIVRMLKKRNVPMGCAAQLTRIAPRRCGWGCCWSRSIHEWNMHEAT
jgi:hypothetical protein